MKRSPLTLLDFLIQNNLIALQQFLIIIKLYRKRPHETSMTIVLSQERFR